MMRNSSTSKVLRITIFTVCSMLFWMLPSFMPQGHGYVLSFNEQMIALLVGLVAAIPLALTYYFLSKRIAKRFPFAETLWALPIFIILINGALILPFVLKYGV